MSSNFSSLPRNSNKLLPFPQRTQLTLNEMPSLQLAGDANKFPEKGRKRGKGWKGARVTWAPRYAILHRPHLPEGTHPSIPSAQPKIGPRTFPPEKLHFPGLGVTNLERQPGLQHSMVAASSPFPGHVTKFRHFFFFLLFLDSSHVDHLSRTTRELAPLARASMARAYIFFFNLFIFLGFSEHRGTG